MDSLWTLFSGLLKNGYIDLHSNIKKIVVIYQLKLFNLFMT